MKPDKYNKYDKTELFFKNLASLYSEKSGNETKKEIPDIDNSYQSGNFSYLDIKVKSKIRAYKVKKWTSRLMPVAACFIIFIAYLAITVRLPMIYFPNNSDKSDSGNFADSPDNAIHDSNTPSEILTFEFVSEKLPTEYTLRKIDYDYQKVIYYIINSEGVEIILSIEEYTGKIDTDGLDQIKIKNLYAYGVSKEDYSFLQYKKDDYLYILTSPNDYSDLIKISENLI